MLVLHVSEVVDSIDTVPDPLLWGINLFQWLSNMRALEHLVVLDSARLVVMLSGDSNSAEQECKDEY
jgi:hypothetical protein